MKTGSDNRASSGYVRYVFIIGGIVAFVLLALFLGTSHIEPDALERLGKGMPLPAFTFLIAIVDGFNPCNIFVLTLLLGFLVSASKSRFRIYLTGYTFVAVVGVFYFLFMAAWLNVFRYIGFVPWLRVTIAIIAIVAGAINCKELFFFKRGISLTIPESEKGHLYRRTRLVREVIEDGAITALVISSATLAIFASLVELPCTAGFPIIYTGILSGRYLDASLAYYAYLAFYTAVYVLPLVAIIAIFGFVLKAGKISQRHVQIIKFIGGLIMILLGVVLLAKPGLIMVQ